MHHAFHRQPATAVDPALKMYAAIITMAGVSICLARHLPRAEDRALALHGPKNVIGFVLPRLCTEQSMTVEANRIHTALFGPEPVASPAAFAHRVALGGYDAIRDRLTSAYAGVIAAEHAKSAREAELAARRRDGQRHLETLFTRGRTERRGLAARTPKRAIAAAA